MRLHIASIGKLKSGAEKTLAADYQTRIEQLARKAGISSLTISEKAESVKACAPERMREEADSLAGMMPAATAVVALDEKGTHLTSGEFAKLIQRHADNATADLAFVIGGPDGLDDAIRKRAVTKIAFGAMTWPHRLVRVMLLEQIYRAITINLRHPYHRN